MEQKKLIIYFKIYVDELPLVQVELLHIRSKIEPFTDVVDLCPRHKLQFIDNFSKYKDTNVLIPSQCTKLLLKQIYMKYW